MPLYFAYGSNMSTSQFELRCPSARIVGKGYLKGYKLSFTYFSSGWQGGVADIVPDCDCEVWGVVYELSQEDLENLDFYEGFPKAYTRFQTEVTTPSGRILEPWVYAVVEKNAFVPPTKEYLRIIKKAATHYEFPKEYLLYLDDIEGTLNFGEKSNG